MKEQTEKKSFFISYNQADRHWAEWIAWQLDDAGYSTIIQAWDFKPGSNFVLEMHKAAERADCTIAVLSPTYLASLYTQLEWAAALVQDPTSDKRKLVPVRVLECEITGLLKPLVYIDLIGLDEDAAKKALLEGIQECRLKPSETLAFPGGTSKATRFPGSLPLHWNVPHSRNRNFTGREELLTKMTSALTSDTRTAITQAISGLGGVGKTQLALEYVYRHHPEYDIVWWVRSEEPSQLADDYTALAKSLKLPERESTETDTKLEAVKRWLGQNGKWLLVFDNVPGPDDIREYIPQSATGHVIITSRNQTWSGVASPLPVRVWDRPESVEFLMKRTGEENADAADEVADELGDLPLALEQAGAYINESECTMSGYLERFRRRRRELWDKESTPEGYNATVTTAWSLAMDTVRKESPTAASLLNLCAYLAPDNVPRELLSKGEEYLPAELNTIAEDNLAMDQVIGTLKRYSLLAVEKDFLSIHRLVQVVIRDRLDAGEKKKWCEAAVRLVNEAYPYDSDDVRTWDECSCLLPHAVISAGHAEECGVGLDAAGRLLNQIGHYINGKAEFGRAKELYSRALAIGEKIYGPDHPTVAIRVNNLGLVLQAQGDLAGAREHFERALAIYEQVHGKDHPLVATSVNNLGGVLQAQGDLAGAREHFERALAIYEQVHGKDHPLVATSVNNLGLVLQAQGDLAGAREHFERALAIDEKIYGPDHPEVATDVINLGSVLQAQGDLAGAREHFERALKILEKFLGKDHEYTLIARRNLGSLEE